MKPLILSRADLSGGAARAARRLHNALLDHDIESCMHVGDKQSDDWRVQGPASKLQQALFMLYPSVEKLAAKLQRTTNPALHSPALIGLRAREINASDADVINLHWVCGGLLSVEEIGRINKPVVWTLHDMWAFCGAEHYAPCDEKARWIHGYERHNRDAAHDGFDIDRWVFGRKRRAWKRSFNIVAPSRWLAGSAKASALMRDWPITVIPNPLDVQTYKPHAKVLAREILRLPLNNKLILFTAIKGSLNPMKGWDLLQPALARIAQRVPAVHGVIVGQSEPQFPPSLGLHLHWLGQVNDDVTLSLIYSAADVVVVPSRQENLPQSGTEAQACGCPVVAFDATGLPDVVEHRKTGYLAKAYSSEDLANGIEWVLADERRGMQLSAQARDRAVRLWAPEVVVPQYLDIYHQTIEEGKVMSGVY